MPARWITLLTLVVLAASCGRAADKPALTICSGAGLIKPIEELRAAFERQRGVSVVASYAGVGELMARMGLEQRCDVFVPGAREYVEEAESRGWIRSGTTRDLVLHVPAIAVPRDNPARIEELDDLAGPGVEVAIGDPSACAIGRAATAIFERNGMGHAMQGNTKVMTPTVNQLLIYVALGEVDAAIVWQDVVAWAAQQERITLIEIPREQNEITTISTGVAAHSENAELARELNDFMGSPEGRRIWERWGFTAHTD